MSSISFTLQLSISNLRPLPDDFVPEPEGLRSASQLCLVADGRDGVDDLDRVALLAAGTLARELKEVSAAGRLAAGLGSAKLLPPKEDGFFPVTPSSVG